jgi:hypothetical protein
VKRRPAVKTVHVKNALLDLLDQPGGISRDKAIASARQRLENLRADFIPALVAEMAKVEDIVASSPDPVPAATVKTLLQHQRVIFNLAGSFGYPALQSIAAGLDDLLAAAAGCGACPLDPILVHVHAARLVAPDAAPMSHENQKELLDQLALVRRHLEGRAR